MDRASSLIYPGSKTLVGWWRQLAPYQPSAIWIGYGFVHRLDAPVTVLATRTIDPLAQHVFQAVVLDCKLGGAADGVGIAADLAGRVTARLGLPEPVVRHVLGELTALGFLTPGDTRRCQPTDAGLRALQARAYDIHVTERRVFPFLERTDPNGTRLAPPQFVPLLECPHVVWQVDDAHHFDPAWLRSTIALTPDARRAVQFPVEVQSLVEKKSTDDGMHVLVDRSERVLLVLILAGAEGARELLGFAVKVDGWTLYDRAPVLRLPAAAMALLPEWFQEPGPTVWQDAWRGWCRQRQMPGNEVEACVLSHHAPRLDVRAPGRLVQRLQASKSDLFKGEAWLLVGEGYVRTAALLSLRESV